MESFFAQAGSPFGGEGLRWLISPFGIPIVAIVCFSLAGIITGVAKQWRKAREAEIEGSLKAEMIKQGRSAEEIESILKATSASRSDACGG